MRRLVGFSFLFVVSSALASAQTPLAPIRTSGGSVTPVFEGWYRNPDGTYTISFGYFNRNSAEVIEIPVGTNNSITPGAANQGQPSRFEPRRNWGVFAVTVPADFGTQNKVVWTLKYRGETFSMAGSLHPDWQIDALEGEAGSGNTPPSIRFGERGPEGRGPAGIVAGPLRATVGTPITLTVSVTDDASAVPSVSARGRGATPVTIAWFKHQGLGAVKFAEPTMRLTPTGGTATTTATFGVPGEYVIRVRVNDSSGVANAGHAQCCWTNGFIKVTVTP